MSIFLVGEGHCQECYTCIRSCPVKAVKMKNNQVDIVEERCIYCGRCTNVCPKGLIFAGDDLENAIKLLDSDKKTIVMLAPEYPASFYPMSSAELVFLIEQAGFYSVEDTLLGEELIAKQYLRYLSIERDYPVIRSTCPSAFTWIEKYHPELNEFLIPVVTPMIAQAKLIKSMYGENTAIIYATPCIAAKFEARTKNSNLIDAVLTFKELKQLLRIRMSDENKTSIVKSEPKPEVRRRYSVAGGFPRPTIARYNMLDTALMVVHNVSDMDELASAIKNGEVKAKLIDLLVCNGCVDGPGIDSRLNIHLRKQIIEQHYSERLKNASEQLTFDQIEPYLPQIDLERSFINRNVNLLLPSEEAMKDILAEGEKMNPSDEINCGACGYKTCRELAIAIYQGIADWGMCFPFQRKVYKRIIKQLQETAVTDGLTGLFNHKSFVERLAVEFNRSKRYGSKLSLIMIDVDTFKEINDTYGHVTGDSVLKAIAKNIKGNIRQSDIAARYGGDEFAVILPETDLSKAFKVGEKLRKKIESTPIILKPDITIYTTLSVGVGSFDPLMTDPLMLVKKADEALYLAKEAGRNKTMLPENVSVE